jgi:hypothetical protein
MYLIIYIKIINCTIIIINVGQSNTLHKNYQLYDHYKLVIL